MVHMQRWAAAAALTRLHAVSAAQMGSGKGGTAGALLTSKALKRLESGGPRRGPPFEAVHLGAFLGRGSSGAVFAGTCAGAPVAVKASPLALLLHPLPLSLCRSRHSPLLDHIQLIKAGRKPAVTLAAGRL